MAQTELINTHADLKGWLISGLIHLGIVCLLYFTIVWKPQNPPLSAYEYGMEVNFGTDDQGFGEEQSLTPPGSDQQKATPPASEPEETQPQPQANQEEGGEEILRSENEEAPAVLPEPVKPTEKPVENPKTTPAPSNTAPSKPSPQSLFPSDNPSSNPNNNGNKPGTTGDMGKKDGNPDARGIYDGPSGKGGRGGTSLDMAGWKWDSKPNINDQSEEEGKIVFQVKVDEEGNLISVTVLEKTVSPALVRKYQREVEALSFSKTSGASAGEGATGRITFIITSR